MNSIVHIAHTTIQFPQNNDTFLYRFSIWLKVPKMRQYFVVFCAIWRSYKVVTIVTKDLQKNYKIVITAIAGIGRRPKIPSYLCFICIYTYKGATKGAASGSCIGAAFRHQLELHRSYIVAVGATLCRRRAAKI